MQRRENVFQNNFNPGIPRSPRAGNLPTSEVIPSKRAKFMIWTEICNFLYLTGVMSSLIKSERKVQSKERYRHGSQKISFSSLDLVDCFSICQFSERPGRARGRGNADGTAGRDRGSHRSPSRIHA